METTNITLTPLDKNKIMHSQKVAEFMLSSAVVYDVDPETAYFTGLNHDIGYLNGKVGHSKSGADFLESLGVSDEVVEAIRNHGKNVYEYSETKKPSNLLILLWTADLSIGKDGSYIGFDARLNDIKERYGENSEQYKNVSETAKFCEDFLKTLHK